MGYSYTGSTHRTFLDSYADDESPFPTDETMAFPRRDHLRDEVGLIKRLFFPRCWNAGELTNTPGPIHEHLDELASVFYTGTKPYVEGDPGNIVDAVIADLPAIRTQLKKDVEAAYKGDPAAKSYLEVIRSYPGFHATMVYRVAHALYEAGAREYAREISEYAKTETGIDIHPGADIGEYFFIDHGTGVVIGETATVGDWVRIYQSVTLGALHFEEEEDEEKMLKKGYKRHPDIGNHVVIGSGSNIMGPIEIGDHVSIGADSWITEDVPEHTTVFVEDHPEQTQLSND
ncbi:MAG: serine O-acetyltransferase EpsC [Halodesulfurarchaeum sp.]